MKNLSVLTQLPFTSKCQKVTWLWHVLEQKMTWSTNSNPDKSWQTNGRGSFIRQITAGPSGSRTGSFHICAAPSLTRSSIIHLDGPRASEGITTSNCWPLVTPKVHSHDHFIIVRLLSSAVYGSMREFSRVILPTVLNVGKQDHFLGAALGYFLERFKASYSFITYVIIFDPWHLGRHPPVKW